MVTSVTKRETQKVPKKLWFLKPTTDMTIHWKALEEHFLMLPSVFRFDHFRGKRCIFWISVLKELNYTTVLICNVITNRLEVAKSSNVYCRLLKTSITCISFLQVWDQLHSSNRLHCLKWEPPITDITPLPQPLPAKPVCFSSPISWWDHTGLWFVSHNCSLSLSPSLSLCVFALQNEKFCALL
jgi:hypothetical protein